MFYFPSSKNVFVDSTSLHCIDYHQFILGFLMIWKPIWCSCSWGWVMSDFLLFSSWDQENFWIIVFCAQYKTRYHCIPGHWHNTKYVTISDMYRDLAIWFYVISCHPNFWLPFIFIHADRHSTKHCNTLFVDSLNQRQERFMHYYLKKICFFCSRSWPQKVELGCGGPLKKMKKGATCFTYSQKGRRGLG
jgi:hypothetical protein